MRIGHHVSSSGSLEKSAERALEIGANTFQIFSASPRMWRAGLPDPAAIRLLNRAREKHDLYPLVIHDNYLINLASTNPSLRAQSIVAFRGELERAVAIGAEYLVAHPGNYKGDTCEKGIIAVVQGLAEAARGLKSEHLKILLENTAGSGCQIGSRLEELAAIRQLVEEHVGFGIGYCIDTCHCFSSGYDIGSEAGLRDVVSTLQVMLGLENIPVIHANDSKTPFKSHVDRHQHIGQGYIGLEGFRRILNHPKLRSKAFILETPSDERGNEKSNVETLKSLCRRSSTTIKRSKPSGMSGGKTTAPSTGR